MDLTEHLSDFTNNTRKFTLRDFIIGFSVVISVIVYTYFMDYYNSENDFVKRIWLLISDQKKTYSFYADNIDSDETSIYAKIGKSLKNQSDKHRDFQLILKGKTGSAYENAFGVMNNRQAFGIVQSDTYLNVPNLKEKTLEIAPIYMERLHTICLCEEDVSSIGDLFKNDIYSKTKFYVGKPGSSSYLIFPLLKSFFQDSLQTPVAINDTLNTVNTSANFAEMNSILSDTIKNNDEKPNKVIMFMMGYNDPIKKLLESNKNLKLLGINAAEVYGINRAYNQELIPTYFPSDFYPKQNVATIGALATIIGSKDLSVNEVAQFLDLFENLNLNPTFSKIFDNPSFSIIDISNKYKENADTNYWSLFKSIMVFIISVTVSAYLTSVLILYILSAFKQSKYYKEMMNIYRDITKINQKKEKEDNGSNIWRTQNSNADRLIDGIRKLNKLGQIVREDFNTGGMTIRHHKYLIDNLNYLEKWFQDKLASRLTYAIANIPQDSIKERASIEDQIHFLYGNSFLLKDDYDLLISLIKEKNT